MAFAAFVGGLAEALFLVTVTRAAFAVTEGKEQVGIVSGWFLTVNQTLLLGLLLILGRLALAAFASWYSARLTSAVVAEVRSRLAAAFLDASWEVQQSQRGGSLQELLTGYSHSASILMGAFSQGVLATANLVALIGMAAAVDPLGAAVLVVSVGFLGLLLRPIRAVVRRRARDTAAAGMEFATSVNEVSDLGMELHVFHVQRQVEAKVAELIEHVRERAVRQQFVQGITSPLYTGLAYLALLGALALVATSDAASLTSLGASMLVMLRSLSYGQALQSAHTSVSSSVPSIEELQRQLAVFEAGRRRDGGDHIDEVGEVARGGHRSSHTRAGLPSCGTSPSASVPMRSSGSSGHRAGGKSTLVELLLGLRDPDRGRVLLERRGHRALRQGRAGPEDHLRSTGGPPHRRNRGRQHPVPPRRRDAGRCRASGPARAHPRRRQRLHRRLPAPGRVSTAATSAAGSSSGFASPGPWSSTRTC